MDFLRNIGTYLAHLYQSTVDYFKSDSESGSASPASAPTDQYRTIELREVQIHELIERSSQRQVQVGCYIQMHRVDHLQSERLQQLLRQHQAPAAAPSASSH